MSDRSTRAEIIGLLVLAAVAAGTAVAGRLPLFGLMIVIGAIAAGEQFRFARARGVHPLPVVGLASIFGMFLAAAWRGERAPEVLAGVVAAGLGLAFVMMILRRSRAGVAQGLLATELPVLVVGLLGAFILAIRGIPHGLRLVLGFGVMVLLADLAVLLIMERDQNMAKRCAVGVAGALAGAVIDATVFSRAFTWGTSVALGILIGLIVAGSDGIASILERALAGTHKRAVMLRRIDGMLLSAPVFFYAYRALAR
jgi:hypothetical protein